MIKTSEYFSLGAEEHHQIAVANLECGHNALLALLEAGVRDFIISPGSRNTPVLVALERLFEAFETDIECSFTIHRVLDERAAAFVALGIARAKAQPAALLCTSGSAAANYFPGIVEANYSEIPLVVLSADRPPELLNCGASQTIDQLNLYGNHVRGFLNLGAPQINGDSQWVRPQIHNFLSEHWKTLLGPVHINLPFRKPLWTREAEEMVFETISLPTPHSLMPARVELSREKVASIASYLGETDKGCIVIGPRCHSQHFAETEFARAVANLGAALGWPVIAEPASGVRFVGEYQAVISMADGILRSPAMVDCFKPEFILRFGKFPTSKSIGQWLATHSDVETIYVSESPRIQDPLRNIETSVLASPTQFCDDIVASLGSGRGASLWFSLWEEAELLAHNVVMQACPLEDSSLWEGAVSHHLANRLPKQSALHLASSMPIRDMDSFAPTRPGDLTVYSSRGANGIDGTIATALGEAMACPTKATTLLVGDLATLHDLGGLHLVAAYERQGIFQAPFVIVVVDNNGGGIFEHLPISTNKRIFEKAFITPQETNLEKLILGLGLGCSRVLTHAEFYASLEGAYARSGVSVIIAEVDRAQTVQTRNQVWTTIASTLEATLGEREDFE